MKPVLGWTMLSRTQVRQVEQSLGNGAQDTRDEIGFLLSHQGFADRFFPGTSVLHTRIRYALFVPWLYRWAARSKRRGSDLETVIGRLLIELAKRLKKMGGEPYGVIGGDKLGQLTSQPPDRVYWTALRTWGLLLSTVRSRSEALRRLQAGMRTAPIDDDGGRLDDEATEVFVGLPPSPATWEDWSSPLHFKLPRHESEFLCRKLGLLARPKDTALSLLANLATAGDLFPTLSAQLPRALDARADTADKVALRVARDAAALAAIGRVVYGALVERLRERDGVSNDNTFREQLKAHFDSYGEAAGRCDLEAMRSFLPDLGVHVRSVLHETQAFVHAGRPEEFASLLDCYRRAEVTRKTLGRARLIDVGPGAQRRAEWDPLRHNTTPLHYRWPVIREMLADLNGSS
jgi:hypothetical protein